MFLLLHCVVFPTTTADFVSRLHDELETTHGLDLSLLYQHFAQQHGLLLQDPHDDTPAAAAAAAAAIAARPRLEWTAPDPALYRLGVDEAGAIEDLGDTTITIAAAAATRTLADRGWRNNHATAEPWEMELAQREEAAIVPTVVFAENEDQDLQVQEHQAEPQEVQRLVHRSQQQRRRRRQRRQRRAKRTLPTTAAATHAPPVTTPMVLGAAAPAVQSGDGPPFTVHAALAQHLKSHQVNGIKFMWRNLFADFELHERGDESTIGGCIVREVSCGHPTVC